MNFQIIYKWRTNELSIVYDFVIDKLLKDVLLGFSVILIKNS